MSIVHFFPDAEAMDQHMEGVGERAARASDYLEFRRFEIYGQPSEETLQIMEKSASSGGTLVLRPEPLSGYLRLGKG